MEENREERTFEDIKKALLEDETWEIPVEERPGILSELAWILNQV